MLAYADTICEEIIIVRNGFAYVKRGLTVRSIRDQPFYGQQ